MASSPIILSIFPPLAGRFSTTRFTPARAACQGRCPASEGQAFGGLCYEVDHDRDTSAGLHKATAALFHFVSRVVSASRRAQNSSIVARRSSYKQLIDTGSQSD